MIKILQKGSDKTFVVKCGRCKTDFTYQMDDVLNTKSVVCPCCDNSVYADYEEYSPVELCEAPPRLDPLAPSPVPVYPFTVQPYWWYDWMNRPPVTCTARASASAAVSGSAE